MPTSRTLTFLITELKEVLPPTLFFAAGFTIIELTTQLILDDYLVRVANFLAAVGAALVVGKAVLVANRFPFLNRFNEGPLFQPILFRTAIYSFVVFLVRLLERVIEYWFGGGHLAGIPDYMVSHFSWHRFLANQIWIFVLFWIYTSISELIARLGDGALVNMIFAPSRTCAFESIIGAGLPGNDARCRAKSDAGDVVSRAGPNGAPRAWDHGAMSR